MKHLFLSLARLSLSRACRGKVIQPIKIFHYRDFILENQSIIMSIGEFAHPELLNPTQDVDPIILEMQKYIPEDATIFEYGTGKGRNAIPLARV